MNPGSPTVWVLDFTFGSLRTGLGWIGVASQQHTTHSHWESLSPDMGVGSPLGGLGGDPES